MPGPVLYLQPRPVLAEGRRLPAGPECPQQTPGDERPPPPACHGARRGVGAGWPGCWTSGPPRPPAVLSSGSGTGLRRSAGAAGLRWADPAAPLGTGPPAGKRSAWRARSRACYFCNPFLPPSLPRFLIPSFLPELFRLPIRKFKFSWPGPGKCPELMSDQPGFQLVSELVSLSLRWGIWYRAVQCQHNANHMCNKNFSSSHVRRSEKKLDFFFYSRYKNCL